MQRSLQMLIKPPHHHRSIWYYVFEATYWLLQAASAKIQAIRIVENLPISHFWWAAGMIIVAILMALAYKHLSRCSWWQALKLGASLLLGRFLTFSPILNKIRKLPFFYVGKGALQDKVLTNWFPIAWAIGILLLMVNHLF